jgi:hypothetical protein
MKIKINYSSEIHASLIFNMYTRPSKTAHARTEMQQGTEKRKNIFATVQQITRRGNLGEKHE